MSWFDKLMPSRINTEKRRRSVPEGLWVKCEGCSAQLYRTELKRNLNVCPKCGHHHYMGARERLGAFLDPDSLEEIGANLEPQDPLKFKDSKRYRDRLSQAQKATGERDALVVMSGALKGMPVVAAAFEFHFMAGSMGSVVGERFARGVYCSIEHERPFVCFAASGGARMQESLYSLLQMGKTSAALAALAEARLPYISVMTDPTTGGVSASLAFLGDVNIAEPGALIGFAGPRVIEQTVKETLPDGFQRAEFLLEKGALDMIVDRRRARDEIAGLLTKLTFHRRSAAAAKQIAAEAPQPQTLLEAPSGSAASGSAPSPPADEPAAAGGGKRAADAGDARPAKVRGPKLRRSRGRAAMPEADPGKTTGAGRPDNGANAPSPAANPREAAAPGDSRGTAPARDVGAALPPDAQDAIRAQAPGAQAPDASGAIPPDARGAMPPDGRGATSPDERGATPPDARGATPSDARGATPDARGVAPSDPRSALPSDARGARPADARGRDPADLRTPPDVHDAPPQGAGTAGSPAAPAGAENLHGATAEPSREATREDHRAPEGRPGMASGHDRSGTPGAKLEGRRGAAAHEDGRGAAHAPSDRAAGHEAIAGSPPAPDASARAQPSNHAPGEATSQPSGSQAEATGATGAPGRTEGFAGQPPASAGQPPASAGADDARAAPSGNAGASNAAKPQVGQATSSGQAPSPGHSVAPGEERQAAQTETPEHGDAGRDAAFDEHGGDGPPGDDGERRAGARADASPHRDAADDSDSSSRES